MVRVTVSPTCAAPPTLPVIATTAHERQLLLAQQPLRNVTELAHQADITFVGVGNIGAPGRVNFTVVGDTVNIAQRFEQLGKEFMVAGEEIVVLASSATIAAIRDREALGVKLPEPVIRQVKGHEDPVKVYRLA